MVPRKANDSPPTHAVGNGAGGSRGIEPPASSATLCWLALADASAWRSGGGVAFGVSWWRLSVMEWGV